MGPEVREPNNEDLIGMQLTSPTIYIHRYIHTVGLPGHRAGGCVEA